MKGLLLHDYYSMKPQINLFIRVILMIFIIGLLLLLGMKYGNLKHLIEDDDEAYEMLVMTFDLFIPFICGFIPFFLIEYKLTKDTKSGWNKYCFSLPANDKARLGATYIISAIAAVIAFIACMLSSITFNVIAFPDDVGIHSLKVSFGVYFFAVTLSYIFIAAHHIIRSKTKLAILTFVVYIVGQLLISYVIVYSDIWFNIFMNINNFLGRVYDSHLYAVALFAVLIALLSYGLSYLITKKWRERLCK